MTESKWSPVSLSQDERDQLNAIGRAMARQTDRYGEASHEVGRSSLIRIRPRDDGQADLFVDNAVGVVATPTVQLVVRPKIPTDHLVFLLEKAAVAPAGSHQAASVGEDSSLSILIPTWFVSAAEKVVEQGLARDYYLQRDELPAIRGRVSPVGTARLFYRGRMGFAVDFEEYDFDTPLNRLLLHACRTVAGAGDPLPESLRRRARRIALQMDGVGRFEISDLTAQTDRRTANYEVARGLAVELLRATGRTLEVGDRRSWTFLFRTPLPVESGIRLLIAERAAEEAVQVNRRKRDLGAGVTINPDLVFEDSARVARAVGDVKYKLASQEWDRGSLYQAVAFAAGYRRRHAAVVVFKQSGHTGLAPVSFGQHHVTPLYWPADDSLPAQEAALRLTDEVGFWLRQALEDDLPVEAQARAPT